MRHGGKEARRAFDGAMGTNRLDANTQRVELLSLGAKRSLAYNETINGRETMAIRITRAGVGLTVGIIVVAALIIGGLFLVKNQGEQARREEAIKVAEKNLEKQSDQEVALNEADKEKDQDKDTKSTNSQSAPGEGESNNSEQDIPSTGASVDGDESVSELPATGPSDSVAIVVLALLAFSTAAYIQSRRQA